MSDRPVTKHDLDSVESKLEQRIDSVESKLEIVAQQVAWLTREAVTRADLECKLADLREELGRDIARHIEAGFRMMRDQFGLQDDRAAAIEDNAARLRTDFTAHTRDFVLHNKP